MNRNPFPLDKILDQTKLKAFANDKLNVTKMIISVFDKVENIVGKGEIACTSNFSFSHDVLKRLLSQTRQRVVIVWEWVKHTECNYARFQKKMCTLFSAIFHCPLCLMSTYLVPKSRSEHVHYNRDFKL